MNQDRRTIIGILAGGIAAIPLVFRNSIAAITGDGVVKDPTGTGGTASFPTQTGHAGQYLTTDGAGTVSWASVTGTATSITYSGVIGGPASGLAYFGSAGILAAVTASGAPSVFGQNGGIGLTPYTSMTVGTATLAGTAASATSLTAQYIDWDATAGGKSIANKPSLGAISGTPATYTVAIWASAASITSLADAGATGQVLTSTGLASNPTWATPSASGTINPIELAYTVTSPSAASLSSVYQTIWSSQGISAAATVTLPATAKNLGLLVTIGATVATSLHFASASASEIYLDGSATPKSVVGMESMTGGNYFSLFTMNVGGAYKWMAVSGVGTLTTS